MEEIVINEEKFRYTWFNSKDQIDILNVIDVDEDRNIVKFLMLHGCRPGEARALRSLDVNIDNLSITIRNTFSKNTLRRRARRKGKKSKPYVVPIHREIVAFIEERVRSNPEGFIFINPRTGGPYMIDAFQAIFVAVRKKLNIAKNIRLYDATRHSFVTQLRRAGLSLSEISKLVGHSSSKITETVYDHADDVDIDRKRIAVSKLSLGRST
ncbi:MAG: tyrosine-type recombinase/integrase [Nitrospiraceae bacterium]|nr:tyrosine-type recombinase/integrase [Nitrospiraceae bacterium]